MSGHGAHIAVFGSDDADLSCCARACRRGTALTGHSQPGNRWLTPPVMGQAARMTSSDLWAAETAERYDETSAEQCSADWSGGPFTNDSESHVSTWCKPV